MTYIPDTSPRRGSDATATKERGKLQGKGVVGKDVRVSDGIAVDICRTSVTKGLRYKIYRPFPIG